MKVNTPPITSDSIDGVLTESGNSRVACSLYASMERPQTSNQTIVTLSKGLKLAEQWVQGMSRITDEEPDQMEIKGRPARLGLGAKFVPHSKVAASIDPVQRKLQTKLNNERKRVVIEPEEPKAAEEDEEDELDSRANLFAKKRPTIVLESKTYMPKKKKGR